MGGAGEGIDGGLHGGEGRRDKASLTPATFNTSGGAGDGGVGGQDGGDLVVVPTLGAGVEMDAMKSLAAVRRVA